MELNIEVCTRENCKVFITDKTVVSPTKGYLPENSEAVVLNRFKYSDTLAVEAIYLERYNEERCKVNDVVFREHEYDKKDIGFEIPITFDGVFTVFSISVPTMDWFLYNKENHPEMLSLYDMVYVAEYDSKKIYKVFRTPYSPEDWSDWQKEGVDIQEVIERNTEGTTLSRTCDTYVSICYLMHCHLSLCQEIFEGHGFSGQGGSGRCFSKSNVDDELIYRRDMVWMALNVIRYLVEANRLQEAQRIIEQIGGCNGLCDGWYRHDGVKPDCGCGSSSSGGRKPECGCR